MACFDNFLINVYVESLNAMTGEAGWTPDQWGHSRFRTLNVSSDNATNQKHLNGFMRSLLKASFLDVLHLDFNFHWKHCKFHKIIDK